MKNNYWNPNNYWNTLNWSNTPTTPFTTNLFNVNTNPFTPNPFTTGVTNYTNNTPTPALVNTYETSENYVLEVSAPGYTKESFEVSFNENNLTINATTEKNDYVNYSYREFNTSDFTRVFTLPTNVDTTETRAKYENGILTILVAKQNNNSTYRNIKIS